jgi:hypothetical protein
MMAVYRSGKPLRHPKAKADRNACATQAFLSE